MDSVDKEKNSAAPSASLDARAVCPVLRDRAVRASARRPRSGDADDLPRQLCPNAAQRLPATGRSHMLKHSTVRYLGDQ
jgi:hypothetical protein